MSQATIFNLSCPSLDQLVEMVDEAIEILEGELALPSAHALQVQAAQCREGLEASLRHSFGPFAQRALSTKVLRLKIEALALQANRIAEERTSSGEIPIARGESGWADYEALALDRV